MDATVRKGITAALVLVLVGALVGCGGTTFDYYNPLDPATAASVEDVLASGAVDPALAQAIRDFWAGAMKDEVNYVGASGYGVTSVEGIEFFPEIWELDLSENAGLAGVDLSSLTRLRRLTRLELNGTVDPDIESIRDANATSVNLAESNVTISDLEVLADMQVREVSVSGPGSPNGAFYTVQGATVFEDLVQSGLAAHLEDRVGLEYFSLASESDFLGIEGLAGTNNLELSFNGIEDPGLLQAFFTASENNAGQVDHDLSLYGNPIDPTLLAGLGPYLQQLESLDLGGLPPHPIEGPVTSLTTGNVGVSETIVRLSVADNSSLTNIEIISGLSNLEELIVSRSDVDDLDLFYSDLPQLRFLAANGLGGGTSLTTTTGISVYGALETVYLRDNANLSDVSELAQLQNLRKLYLSGSLSVSDAQIQAVIDSNPEVYIEYPDGSVYAGG